MTMLEILSENRGMKAHMVEAEPMLTQVDIKQLPSYSIGFEDGESTGEARGEALIVLRLLTHLNVGEVADLLRLCAADVERIAARGDHDKLVDNRP
jgi:hypothetical protein